MADLFKLKTYEEIAIWLMMPVFVVILNLALEYFIHKAERY
jgi:hypothetical protein